MIRLFRVFIPGRVLTLLISEAVLATFSYVLAAYLVLQVDPTVFLLYDGGLLRTLILVGTILFGLYLHDLYTHIRIRSRTYLLQQIIQTIGIALVCQGLIGYLNPEWMLPRWVAMIGSGVALASLFTWRVLYSSVIMGTLEGERVLFLGTNEVVREIAAFMAGHPELGIRTAGYLASQDEDSDVPPACGPCLGKAEDARAVVQQIRPDRLVVGLSERRRRMPVDDLLDLRFGGLLIEDAGKTYQATCGRICVRELRPSDLIYSDQLGPRRGNLLLQTVYSLLIAATALALLWPVMLLTAIAIKLTSRGPVFYRQKRVGRGGAPFMLYKFRSMRQDAEAGTGAVWASADDPRVTPLGKWLRRLRIDEFPQLFNVLRGEMSIVGPRPERPEFVEVLSHKIPFYRQRHAVKPGITGWAQINHRYADTIEDTIVKLEYDLYYIKNVAPALDAYIMFHTLKTMLLFRGAQ